MQRRTATSLVPSFLCRIPLFLQIFHPLCNMKLSFLGDGRAPRFGLRRGCRSTQGKQGKLSCRCLSSLPSRPSNQSGSSRVFPSSFLSSLKRVDSFEDNGLPPFCWTFNLIPGNNYFLICWYQNRQVPLLSISCFPSYPWP